MENPLIEVTCNKFDVELCIAYATADNFTRAPVYLKPACFLHRDAIPKLETAIDLAGRLGYRLKIWDAFRPLEAQAKLFEHTPNPMYVSPPENGPRSHCRGAAIDLTLIDQQGNELDMGAEFDEFHERSHHAYRDISREAQHNRLLLAGIMHIAGFEQYRYEWWHYQLPNCADYPVLKDVDLKTGLMVG
ncbi:D-alanyl-D-alanine dipeptidase [Spongorhabdus nitratireducens]